MPTHFLSVHHIIQADSVVRDGQSVRNYQIKQKFAINFIKDYFKNFNIEKDEDQSLKKYPIRSSSGRKIQMRNIKDSVANLDDYLGNKELAYTYNNDLNILGILIAINDDDDVLGLKEGDEDEEDEEDDDNDDYIYSNSRRVSNRRNKKKKKKKPAITIESKPNVFIQLYDNFNGSFLKKFSFYSNRNNSIRISYQLFIHDDKLIVIEKSFQNKIFLFSLNFDRD